MDEIKLRKATLVDADMVFDWRNDSTTRNYSFDSNILDKDRHIEWFNQTLHNSHRCLLIAEFDNQPIGVLRYDFCEEKAVTHIYLCPGMAGNGLGPKILLSGTEWIRRYYPHIKFLQAKIMSDNIISKRAFEKAGYDLQSYVLENTLEKNLL